MTPESATPVVGIGASAGGLDAFRDLLRAVPADTGLAFVLVQHLAPKSEPALTHLLAKATAMPVAEITQGMRVEPNHVYVIPANADLSLVEGLLHTTRRTSAGGRHLPIDYFLRSLAESRGTKSIGVVLSGMASDGSAGIIAVKEAGGVTFAQDPETAEYDSMPQNAIDTGCVDFILSPERIAKELARIVRHPLLADDPGTLPGGESEWERLFHILRASAGVDFRLYKQGTVKRRVARRMAVNKAVTLKTYLKILERNPAEAAALFDDLLILVTEFFRDPEAFAALQTEVFPQILKQKRAGEPIRVWSAGCSTGQEAYSLAIALLEYLARTEARPEPLRDSTPAGDASPRAIQIFGTDLSEAAIAKARRGVYSEAEVKGVSSERLQRFFKRVDHGYQISSAIREMCIFARHDLTRDPPFSNLDLLSCRNVLMYFGTALQKKALSSFHYALKPGGVLMLGKSEGVSAKPELFSEASRQLKFFTRAGGPPRLFDLRTPLAPPAPRAAAAVTPLPAAVELQRKAEKWLWERSGCAGLIVNNALQILHFRGNTSPYLNPAPGRASLQLLNILRDEIGLDVRSAIEQARRTGQAARTAELVFRHDQRPFRVRVEVRPLLTEGLDKGFLILFEPARSAEPSAPDNKPRKRTKPETGETSLLRTELARTREHVRKIVGDQERANEELRTANEEAVSNTEELQSANEELENAKEELESANEELRALNEQLEHRNSELGELSADLSNILSELDVPIVALGPDTRIRRFTPPAMKLLGLIAGDIGRPLGQLRMNVKIPDLDNLIVAAVRKGRKAIREVQASSGQWFRLRVQPFRPDGNKIEGVLLTFVDIDEIRRNQDSLRRDANFISAILDAATGLLVIVLDATGRITHFNRACQQATGYSLKEVQGRLAWDFLLDPGEVESIKGTFRELAGGASNQRENYWIAKDGRRILISWSNSVVKSGGAVESIIGTGIDVTAREEARRQAQQSEATLRALLDSAAEAILAIDKDGRIVLANPMAEKMFGYSRAALLRGRVDSLMPERFRAGHRRHRAAWFNQPHNRPMGKGLDLAGLRKDGSQFPIEVSLSSISTGDGMLGVAFVSDITERKKNERTLLEYKDQLQKLTGALLSAQETGNREIARELHDVFSQELAATGMEISSLKEALKTDPGAAARLAELGARIGRLSADLHRTARELHPAILEELGLEAALQQECDSFQKKTGIATKFTASKAPERVPREVALCLYRAAQESLRNVHKHSLSPRVEVLLQGKPGGIALRIEDTGDGFDLDEAMKKGGLGLISMEERVRLVNGKLNVDSAPGKGTIVSVTVPLDPAQQDKEPE